MSSRDVVFVSHANPEENDFARWLALKLGGMGYRSWSDVTQLLGGEDFWAHIEPLIRNETAKFFYVLSRNSNHRQGCLRELHVAIATAEKHGFKDFIIPVRVDDLPHSEMNIQLARLNAINFDAGWASGLKQLVTKLREDKVRTNTRYSPNAVCEWWQRAFDVEAGVTKSRERHLSSWFSVVMPDYIYAHTTIGPVDDEPRLPFPGVWHRLRLISFASASELQPALGSLRIRETERIDAGRFMSEGPVSQQRDHRDILTRLLTDAWERFATGRGLRSYELASRKQAFYFDLQVLPNENVSFMAVDGRNTHRALMGYRTTRFGKRHWHFAVSAKPAIHPRPMLILRAHVLFSDDGLTLWSSAARMHRARRSQCKKWWNDDWRDRILATLKWLAQEATTLALPMSATTPGLVSVRPIDFMSPVTLEEPEQEAELPEDSATDDFSEDEDEPVSEPV